MNLNNQEQMKEIDNQLMTLMLQKTVLQSSEHFDRMSELVDKSNHMVETLLNQKVKFGEAYNILLDYITSRNLLNDVLHFMENEECFDAYSDESFVFVSKEVQSLIDNEISEELN